jgi:hypothetical protein
MDNVRNNPSLLSEASQALREYDVGQKRECFLRRMKLFSVIAYQYRKEHCLVRMVPGFVLSTGALLRWGRVRNIRPITLTGENWSTRKKNSFQCHFVHHECHNHKPGIEPDPLRWEAGDFKTKITLLIYEALVGISQKTQYISIMTTNLWKLCRRNIAVCCDSGTEDVSSCSCTWRYTQLPDEYLQCVWKAEWAPTSGKTMKSIKILVFIHKNNGEKIYDLKGVGT